MICGTQERSGLSQPSLPLLGYCTCSSIESLRGTGEERLEILPEEYTHFKKDDIKESHEANNMDGID